MRKFENCLILSDMDGTLLNDALHVSSENAEAIRYFISQGGRFSVCTGRTKPGMEHFLPEVDINAPAIISNGAIIYDFERDAPVSLKLMGEKGVRMAQDIMERFDGVGVEVVTRSGVFVLKSNFIVEEHCRRVKVPFVQRDAASVSEPWINMLITREPERMAEVEEHIRENYNGSFFMQYSAPFFLEVMANNAHKGASAIELRDLLGVPPDRLIVAGDGENDVELLSCSELSFATRNACPKALAAARFRLPSNEEHAIRELIRILDEKIILG